MVISLEDKIDAAIKSIRRFHAIGRKSLRKLGSRAAKAQIEDETETPDLKPFDLRKARQFADSDKGYITDELEVLCDRIRKSDSGSVFGWSHLKRLLAAPKSKRE